MKRLRHDHTPEQMDRGEWMLFHPVTGAAARGGSFTTPLPSQPTAMFDADTECYWYWGCYGLSVTEARIGDGRSRRRGDPYPGHWLFDPYTGKRLLCYCTPPAPVVRPRTGWELDD